jgi:cytochrome c-type biogenesis protein CcmH/NrfF
MEFMFWVTPCLLLVIAAELVIIINRMRKN